MNYYGTQLGDLIVLTPVVATLENLYVTILVCMFKTDKM